MNHKNASTACAVLAALVLSACGGGSSDVAVTTSPNASPAPTPAPAPAPAPQTVPFKWASLSQAIPAGKTSLDLPVSDCQDGQGLSVKGKVTMSITADGDFVYTLDGVDQVMVRHAERSSALVSVSNDPKTKGQLTMSAEAPDRFVGKASAASPKAAAVLLERVTMSSNTVQVKRSRINIDVSCRLTAPLTANGSMTQATVYMNVVPSTNKVSHVQVTALNGSYFYYDASGEAGASGKMMLGLDRASASAVTLESSSILDTTQRFSSTPVVPGGVTFTQWLELNVGLDQNGTRRYETLFLGYSAADTQPQLKVSGDPRTAN